MTLKMRDVLVNAAIELARQSADTPRQSKPWQDPLPACLPVSTLSENLKTMGYAENDTAQLKGWLDRMRAASAKPKASLWRENNINWRTAAMRVTVGLVDHPSRAQQQPLVIDFKHGNLVLFGAGGMGKTTFLRTLVAGLAASHSPEALHMYLLDFGGGGLVPLAALPQVANVLLPSDVSVEEQIPRLMRRLTAALDWRKNHLIKAKAESIFAYNAANEGKAIPALLLVIDNFARFFSLFENQYEALVSLLREGRAYGIHVVITAEMGSSVPKTIDSMFADRLALKLNDPNEYQNVLGKSVPTPDDLPGRGYLVNNRVPLEFHTATLFGEFKQDIPSEEVQEVAEEDFDSLHRLAAMMDTAWGKLPRPEPVGVLSAVVPLAQVLAKATNDALGIGLQESDLQVADVSLSERKPHLLIAGLPYAGKTNALLTFALSLAYQMSPQQATCCWVDFQQRPQGRSGADMSAQNIAECLPHCLKSIRNTEELAELVATLKEYYEGTAAKDREFYLLIDNYEDLASAYSSGRENTLRDLAELARRFGVMGLHIVAACATNQLNRLLSDDVFKHVLAARYALALDLTSIEWMNLRIPRPSVEPPVGRSHLVFASRPVAIQVAHSLTEDDPAALESLLEAIKQRHGDR